MPNNPEHSSGLRQGINVVQVLDGRVYRTAFLPALLALFLAAFALQDRPSPGRSELPADAFSSERAFGTVRDKNPGSLQGLAAEFPDRTPGSPGDQALADAVAEDLAAPWAEGERATFTVRKTTDDEGYTTVVATRPGPSPRRIVVLADRDPRGREHRLPGRARVGALGGRRTGRRRDRPRRPGVQQPAQALGGVLDRHARRRPARARAHRGGRRAPRDPRRSGRTPRRRPVDPP